MPLARFRIKGRYLSGVKHITFPPVLRPPSNKISGGVVVVVFVVVVVIGSICFEPGAGRVLFLSATALVVPVEDDTLNLSIASPALVVDWNHHMDSPLLRH